MRNGSAKRLVGSTLSSLLLLAGFTDLLTAKTLAASPRVIWQLGQFDYSSAEFNNTLPPGICPIFVIGRSRPNEWCGFQPGSANGRFGNKPHPRIIEFIVDTPPTGLYRMRIALLVEHAGIPSLQVDINGKRGSFYQHPTLNYSMGDGAAAWFPTYSSSTINFVFPSNYLRLGTNRIVLTAIDQHPPGQELPDAPPWAGDSGIVYDAVSLEHDNLNSDIPAAVAAQIEPTVFYRRKISALQERVDVFIRLGESFKHVDVDLSMDGQTFAQSVPLDRDFGELRISFDVPEFARETHVKLAVLCDGHAFHFDEAVRPAKKWTLFVVPNEHLDVGYTDFAAKVAEVHSRVIEEAMQLNDKFPDFRFTLDGFWEAAQFQAGRTNKEKERFYQKVRENQIVVPVQYASLLTQFASAETLIRSLYEGSEFNHLHGVSSEYVSSTDIPSFSWSYASLLAASGFKYFIAGSNNDASPILLFGRHHEHSPFWWEGPDGKRILMWYSRMYTQVASLFGMPPDLNLGTESLPIFLQMYDHVGYPSNGTIVYGTQPENTDLYPEQASFVADWNEKYAFPILKYSSFSDAMDFIVGNSQDALPVMRGDGGSFWESFNTADAKYAALERENEARALSAEKVSTLSAVVDPRIAIHQPELQVLWRDLVLMDEHTWNSSRSVSQPHSRQTIEQQSEKESLAINAHQIINRLLEKGMSVLADQVSAPAHSLLVFNSLSWTRSGLVELDLDAGWQIVDGTTQQLVPYETLSRKLSHRVRFFATDVPAVGYKVFRLERIPIKAGTVATAASGAELESPYYRVRLDPQNGALLGIYDRQLQRELVNQSSSYRFGQYVYVTGGDTLPNRLVAYRTSSPFPKLTSNSPTQGRVVSVTRTPFGTVAKLRSSALNTPLLSTEIVLFDKQKKIEMTYEVQKNEVFRKEGVYFAFPLAFKKPHFRYEIQTTSIDPSSDMLAGAGLETFSVQHWISAYENNSSATIIPLDAPIMALGDIVRGTFPDRFTQRSGTLFSFTMSNYHYDNWPGMQGGHFLFRYVFTSGPTSDSVALTRLGWEEATPLEIDEVTPQDKVEISRPLPASASFIEIDRPDVLLQTWKAAEDGDGMIMRFLAFGEQDGNVSVTLPHLNLHSAWFCTALEDNQGQLPVRDPHHLEFEIRPHETITLRIRAQSVDD